MINYIERQQGYISPCSKHDRRLQCLVAIIIIIGALVALYTLLTTYLGA